MNNFRSMLVKNVAIPSAAYTAGTSFTVAHGLGYKPNINCVDVIAFSATATGTDDVQLFGVQAVDATNITLKPSRTATSNGTIRIFLDTDIGGRQIASA